VAVKKFLPSDATQEHIFRKAFEVERNNLVKTSSHDNILAMLGSFERPERDSRPSFNLIFPFATGGDLFRFLRLGKAEHKDPGLPFPQALVICKDYGPWEHGILDECLGLLSAISYIYHNIDNNIIHQDINPSNILIYDRKFKLAGFDFGESKSGTMASVTAWRGGTKAYNPPEYFQSNSNMTNDQLNQVRDVWALGCVFLELVVMLASSRHDYMPSVEEFERTRIRSSEIRGDEYSGTFAKTMDCVKATVKMIIDLRDPHLECLLQIAMMMLEVDCNRRPQASFLHGDMMRTYASLKEDLHFSCEIIDFNPPETTTADEPRQVQISGRDILGPAELARFWYLSFWHNNYRRFYPFDDRLAVSLAMLCMLIIGLVGTISLANLKIDGRAEDDNSPLFDKSLFGLLQGLGYLFGPSVLGLLFGALLYPVLFSLIPCRLLPWFFMRQAVKYLASCTISQKVQGDESGDTAREKYISPLNHTRVWTWIC
jgi:serine/threonine protein kinase